MGFVHETFPVTHYRCSLLVVDDDPSVRTLLATVLAEEFEVSAVSTGAAALEILAQRSIDIVLVDQKLADMAGVQ